MDIPALPASIAATQQASFYSSNDLSSAQAKKDPNTIAGMFEAMFYRSILQQMRAAGIEDEVFGSGEMQQMQGMFDDELAVHMGLSGHLGIKDIVLDQVKNQSAAAPADLLKQAAYGPPGLLKELI